MEAVLLRWMSRHWNLPACLLRRHRTGSNVALSRASGKKKKRWRTTRGPCLCLSCDATSLSLTRMHTTGKLQEQERERTVELFFSSREQTCKLRPSHPNPAVTVVLNWDCASQVLSLSDDDTGMVCDLCKGYFFPPSPPSPPPPPPLMISPDINFNKFLRICWCMLISGGVGYRQWTRTKKPRQ